MSTFNGTSGNNTFNGSSADDVFNYGAVNYAADGTTIVSAMGFDTITSGGGHDTAVFSNLGIDYIYGHRVGDAFVLSIQPTTDWNDATAITTLGGVTINNFYAADGSGVIDRVNFKDGHAELSFAAGIFQAKIFDASNVLVHNNIDGSDGNDSITGLSVSDYLGGGLGNDTLSGLAGDDELDGNEGNDLLIGGAGNDTLDGGTGIDTASYSTANGSIDVNLGSNYGRNGSFASGNATNIGNDTLYGIERVIGGNYADRLVGNGGTNVLTGGGGADTLIGGAGNDSLVGGAGGDTFDGSASSTVLGGSGNDTIDGGTVTDRINYLDGNTLSYASSGSAVSVNLATGIATDGGGGTDTLRNINFVTGSAYNDSITGSSGHGFELFNGGAGNDTIDGGIISDTLNGTDYNRAAFNQISAGVTVDLLAGTAVGQGSDTLRNINQVSGSNLADTLLGSNRVDVTETLEGRGGIDTLDGRGGTDIVRYSYAGNGVSVNLATGVGYVSSTDHDTLSGFEGVRGSNYNDTLTGGNSSNDALEFFRGMGGNDTIDGGPGYDRVDYVDAMQGVTVTLGGAADGTATDGLAILNGQIQFPGTAGAVVGVDTLRHIEAVRGSNFADTLNGSSIATEESFEGRAGNDTIDGGAGIDRAVYFTSTSGATVTLGLAGADGTAADGWGGTDTLRGIENVQGSRDFADQITGNELANKLDGLGGNDTLSGGAGNDTLLGGDGNDALIGSSGNDSIVGGAGNDLLYGGTGKDVLSGGAGLDAFRFSGTLSATTNVDKITDFVAADDTIQLDHNVFAGVGALGALSADAFALGAAADAGDRIIYDSASGNLYFDADGNGAGAAVLFATVTAGTTLTASDFLII